MNRWVANLHRAVPTALAASLLLVACGDDTAPADVVDVVFQVPDVDAGPPYDVVTDTVMDASLDASPDGDSVGAEVLGDGDAQGDVPYDPFATPREPVLFEAANVDPVGCVALHNPGAEAGSLDGWTVVTGSPRAQRDTGVFQGSFPAPHSGELYIFAGKDEEGEVRQDVNITELMTAAEGAPRWAQLSVWTRSDNDHAYAGLAGLTAQGLNYGDVEIGPWARDSWQLRTVVLKLDPEVRTVRVSLRGDRKKGDNNDAYFDDVRLCLYDQQPPLTVSDFLSPPYLMSPAPDGAIVLFETETETVATVRYGASPETLDGEVSDGAPSHRHELHMERLQPGTRAFYKVEFDDKALPAVDFLTAPLDDSTERVEFVMFADNQDGPDKFRENVAAMAALDPDFILQAGDCVQNGTKREYRELFFGPLYGLGDKAPMAIGAGNHETYAFAIVTSLDARALWEEVVAQPGDEHCFGMRWGPLFVLVLDTERPHANGNDQYACAEAALQSDAAQTAQFRTAIFHRPALIEWWDMVAGFSSPVTFFAAGMDAPNVREHLAPLFEANGVQLVFNGHNHLYQYAKNYPYTVDWVSSGGGGGVMESGVEDSRVNDWSAFVDTTIFGEFHFLHVVIDQGVMGVRAVTPAGDVLHSFIIEQ